MDSSSPSVAEHSAEVGGALVPRTADMSADIYRLIVQEIPQLRGDVRVLKLLEASVGENVAAMLHIIQHGIDLENVHAPSAAGEYARRLAQRGVPVAALLQGWVIETLGTLAGDDDHNARLRGTLAAFLQETGSYKATAERLTVHKNTVQYRIRKAEESLGRPVGEDRLHIELALLASEWLGPAVLRQAHRRP